MENMSSGRLDECSHAAALQDCTHTDGSRQEVREEERPFRCIPPAGLSIYRHQPRKEGFLSAFMLELLINVCSICHIRVLAISLVAIIQWKRKTERTIETQTEREKEILDLDRNYTGC